MLAKATDAHWCERLCDLSGTPAAHLTSLKDVADFLSKRGATNQAASIVEFGLRHNPLHAGLLACKASLGRPWEEKDLRATMKQLAEVHAVDANGIGVELWQQSQYRSAASVFETVIARNTNSATAWVNLGVNREALGDYKSAEMAYLTALALDPVYTFARESYQRFVRRLEDGKPK